MAHARTFLISGIFAGASIALGSSALAETLSGAVRTAVATNPRIIAAQANREATDYTLDQAAGRFYPEVDLSADVGKQRVDRPQGLGPLVNDQWRTRRQVTLSVRQVLFDGYDRANDYYRSQARITAAAHKVLARAELVALNAIEAYIDVRRHRNLVALADRNIARHRSLLSLIRAQVEGGKATASDLNQTRERLDAARALRAQIKIALGTAIAKYESAVGRKPHKLTRVRYPKHLPRSQPAAFQTALVHNPRIAASQSEVDVAEFSKRQFESTLYPQFFLEGSGTRGEELDGTPDRNNELKAMVTMRWRLYDGGTRRARISELEARKFEKQAEVDILRRDIGESIGVAWARYTSGQQQLSAVRRQVDRNRTITGQYREEFRAGKRSLLDVLDAENSRFGSEFDLSNVGALHLFSAYQLLGNMGVLLDRLGVAPPPGSHLPVSDPGLSVSNSLAPRSSGPRRSFVIPSLK